MENYRIYNILYNAGILERQVDKLKMGGNIMYCKKCGADIGPGYPQARFCHMCGADLAPSDYSALIGGTQFKQAGSGTGGQTENPWHHKEHSKVGGYSVNRSNSRKVIPFPVRKDVLGISFTRRILSKTAFRLLLAGVISCVISMFLYWIPPVDSAQTIKVPNFQDTYKKDQYGGLKSIEARHSYDTYTAVGESSGYHGHDMALSSLTFLLMIGIILWIFYKPGTGMPLWAKCLPHGILAYFIWFWVAGFTKMLRSSRGMGMGLLIFPIGVLLLYKGSKRVNI